MYRRLSYEPLNESFLNLFLQDSISITLNSEPERTWHTCLFLWWRNDYSRPIYKGVFEVSGLFPIENAWICQYSEIFQKWSHWWCHRLSEPHQLILREISCRAPSESSSLWNNRPILLNSELRCNAWNWNLNTNVITELNQFEATNFMKTADRENCENTKEK